MIDRPYTSVTAMPARQTKTVDQETVWNGENVSSPSGASLEDLLRRAAELDRSVGFWNNAYIALLLIAAVFTALVVFAQYKVITKQRRFAAVQADAGILKEQAFRAELHNKDLQLRTELDQKNREVADSLKDKDLKISEATGIAAKASERTAELELRTEELNKLNLETESKLEKERITRLEMQASLSARSLRFPINNERFKRFAGTSVGISFLSDDPETRRLANAIRLAVERSGWEVISIASDDHPYLEMRGVVIVVNDSAAGQAAEDLESLLLANSVDTRLAPHRSSDSTVPSLRIIVGTRPTPYFDNLNVDEPAPIDERHKELREMRKTTEETRKLERLEMMRRLHQEWFPPGVNTITK